MLTVHDIEPRDLVCFVVPEQGKRAIIATAVEHHSNFSVVTDLDGLEWILGHADGSIRVERSKKL